MYSFNSIFCRNYVHVLIICFVWIFVQWHLLFCRWKSEWKQWFSIPRGWVLWPRVQFGLLNKVNLLYLTPQVTVLNIKPRPQPYSNINQVFQVPKHNRQNVRQDSVLCWKSRHCIWICSLWTFCNLADRVCSLKCFLILWIDKT